MEICAYIDHHLLGIFLYGEWDWERFDGSGDVSVSPDGRILQIRTGTGYGKLTLVVTVDEPVPGDLPPAEVDERVCLFLDNQLLVESILNGWGDKLFDASDRPGWYGVRVRAWDRGDDGDPPGEFTPEKWRLDFTYEGAAG